VRLYEVRVYVM